MVKSKFRIFLVLVIVISCNPGPRTGNEEIKVSEEVSSESHLIPVIFDTDANNELDDQHAMAYLFFNGRTFDVLGVTVNATYNGGEIEEHFTEAERILKLCDVHEEIPLFAGGNADFDEIRQFISEPEYDGKEAVEFIIEEARKPRDHKLVLLPVGKLTNIALAIEKAPDISEMIRIVWLGSNYPEKGEYNQENDIPALNYILDQDVSFEMVMVRYGQPSGSDAVRATPSDISKIMPGKGPKVNAITGRHGGTFTNFGDYSVNLFDNAQMHGDPPSRALFDMVAVAIIKDPSWGEKMEIPAPILVEEEWKERPDNSRKIIIWENFEKEFILADFYTSMQNPVTANKE